MLFRMGETPLPGVRVHVAGRRNETKPSEGDGLRSRSSQRRTRDQGF